ncbi:MAG: TetR/AcrR family transcriptional regulator [Candidatus Faecousia sp.]|nr:TetR/AcrR family transcriptional regulator [Candidatus Faecousia sp.]
MNEKFYSLPAEKRQRIISAGFYVFSQNSYKKSSMNEIAQQAQISKSLLFFYFRNKQELYLFLWDTACKLTVKYLNDYRCYEPGDLFQMMERGMNAKLALMEKYPYMANFAIRAFFEKDKQVSEAIQTSYRSAFSQKAAQALSRLNPEDFIPGLDLNMMHRQMHLASEGYLWEMMQRGEVNWEQVRQDFGRLLEFWKSVYYSEEKKHECH